MTDTINGSSQIPEYPLTSLLPTPIPIQPIVLHPQADQPPMTSSEFLPDYLISLNTVRLPAIPHPHPTPPCTHIQKLFITENPEGSFYIHLF